MMAIDTLAAGVNGPLERETARHPKKAGRLTPVNPALVPKRRAYAPTTYTFCVRGWEREGAPMNLEQVPIPQAYARGADTFCVPPWERGDGFSIRPRRVQGKVEVPFYPGSMNRTALTPES